MNASPGDIGALVGSRLCHDLISPIGAIANGVELLRLTGGADGPELALIADSAAQAAARLRFFRIALGAAPEGQALSSAEIAGILGDLGAHGRVALRWEAEGEVPRAEARLVFLLLLCAEAALPRGGSIAVTRRTGTWEVRAQGARIDAEGPAWQALAGNGAPAPPAPSEVQFLLAPVAAASLGRRIGIEAGESRLTLTV